MRIKRQHGYPVFRVYLGQEPPAVLQQAQQAAGAVTFQALLYYEDDQLAAGLGLKIPGYTDR